MYPKCRINRITGLEIVRGEDQNFTHTHTHTHTHTEAHFIILVFSAKCGNKTKNMSSSECSAQGQVFHCKRSEPSLQFYRRQVFHRKLGNQACSFTVGLNRCGSFPLLSAPHSLFSIWTDIKICEKIPGAPLWRWGERIWLTGPSGLHRNSPQVLNISSIRVFDQIRD